MKNNVKVGICQWSLPIEGPYACKLASDLGFDGIQLDLGKYERGFPLSKEVVQQAYLEMSEKYEISFPSIAITELDFISMVAPVGTEDAYLASMAIRKAVDAAEAMGISMVMLPSFEKSNIKTEVEFQRAVTVLREACDYAENRKVKIATENLLSVGEIQRLFEEVNRENLSLYFDTQNYFLNKGLHTPDLIEPFFPYMCDQVHIKDGKVGELSGSLIGRGDTCFEDSMEILRSLNYCGWLIYENYYDRKPLSEEDDNPINLIKEDLKILDSFFEKKC